MLQFKTVQTLDLLFLRKDDFDVDDVIPSLNVYDLNISVGSDHSFIEFGIPFNVTHICTFGLYIGT